MKGHMEKDGFHPHTQYKGVRKSRDQKLKTQGIKVTRKARVKANIPSVHFNEDNWGFDSIGGKITKLRLGNWTTAGWNWDGDENDILGYLVRIDNSQLKDEWVEKMEKEGITFSKLKPLLLSKVKKGTWLYEISGDNTRWHFHQDVDLGAMAGEAFEPLEDEYNEEQIEKISEETITIDDTYEFEDFEEDFGDSLNKQMTEMLKSSNTYTEFFNKISDEDFKYGIDEDYIRAQEEKINDVLFEAIAKLKAKGELKPTREQRMEKQVAEGGQKRL